MPPATAPNIMDAITALLTGLTQNISRSRAEQLQGLSLLAQQPGMSLTRATAPEPTGFFRQLMGQAYEPTPSGAPVVSVGGIPFTASRAPDLRYAVPQLFEGETALPAALQALFAGQPRPGPLQR